jgi:hypothetical protein
VSIAPVDPCLAECAREHAQADQGDQPVGDELDAPEARVGRLRERLKAYLQDRPPLRLNGLEFGFFPTKGRYDVEGVFRAATEAGVDPLTLLSPDGRALAAFLKARPAVERTLAAEWTPTPPWFGHRKSQARTSNPVTPRRSSSVSTDTVDDRHNAE